MKLAVFGCGYVGLVTGACFAELGNNVIIIDVDKKKVENLKKVKLPFYEFGLKELIERNLKAKRISFTTDAPYAIKESDVLFIAVNTPEDKDGKADLRYVFQVAETIGRHMNGYKVVVDKSTVPVGTADKVRETIKKQQNKHEFDVVSNPEFLREGSAVNDFMNPDRIVIGADNGKAKDILISLYKGIERAGRPIIVTDVKTAEIIKYASNAMLSARISFMNQLAILCDKVGADVKLVAKGIGLDGRIGHRFLQAGIGYGGSCFVKDVRALIQTMKQYGCDADIFEAVDNINVRQIHYFRDKIIEQMGSLKGKTIAIWGLAFKPKTSDMRNAPSIRLIDELQKLGAKINAYDPEAMEEAKAVLKNVVFCKNAYDAATNSDAVVLATEWNEFRDLDFEKIKSLMKNPLLFDGRNIYDPLEIKKKGFAYVGVGRKVN
ncbi:MAG: UDP-glucose/GDP-mannose dehydrogenase family protein [Candidatus Woesearchaeota archaeon]